MFAANRHPSHEGHTSKLNDRAPAVLLPTGIKAKRGHFQAQRPRTCVFVAHRHQSQENTHFQAQRPHYKHQGRSHAKQSEAPCNHSQSIKSQLNDGARRLHVWPPMCSVRMSPPFAPVACPKQAMRIAQRLSIKEPSNNMSAKMTLLNRKSDHPIPSPTGNLAAFSCHCISPSLRHRRRAARAMARASSRSPSAIMRKRRSCSISASSAAVRRRNATISLIATLKSSFKFSNFPASA